MPSQVINLTCPGCGAPVDTTEKNCKYCGRPIVVTSFNSVYGMSAPEVMKYKNTYQKVLNEQPESGMMNSALGMCLLKLNMYDKAFEKLNLAIEEEMDNSETYFWAAVALLKGKRPFITPKSVIDQAIEYTTTATMVENRGLYYFYLAYLKFDYYAMKKLNITPNYYEELENAKLNGVSVEDIRMLGEILKVEFPEELLL